MLRSLCVESINYITDIERENEVLLVFFLGKFFPAKRWKDQLKLITYCLVLGLLGMAIRVSIGVSIGDRLVLGAVASVKEHVGDISDQTLIRNALSAAVDGSLWSKKSSGQQCKTERPENAVDFRLTILPSWRSSIFMISSIEARTSSTNFLATPGNVCNLVTAMWMLIWETKLKKQV